MEEPRKPVCIWGPVAQLTGVGWLGRIWGGPVAMGALDSWLASRGMLVCVGGGGVDTGGPPPDTTGGPTPWA